MGFREIGLFKGVCLHPGSRWIRVLFLMMFQCRTYHLGSKFRHRTVVISRVEKIIEATFVFSKLEVLFLLPVSSCVLYMASWRGQQDTISEIVGSVGMSCLSTTSKTRGRNVSMSCSRTFGVMEALVFHGSCYLIGVWCTPIEIRRHALGIIATIVTANSVVDNNEIWAVFHCRLVVN
ncbi:tRNA (guanine-N(7)-)-methyltransferase [Dirofilaria immitis]